MSSKIFWTDAEDQVLRENHGVKSATELAVLLGRTNSSVKNRRNILQLKMDEEKRTERHLLISKFQKGYPSYNKGKKRTEYLSAEQIEAIKRTQFAPGNKPHNTKFDGAESVRIEKRSGRQYLYVRISEKVWREKHRIIWEEANGKIPKGYNVVFKDGNTLNVSIQNLELVSDSELMSRNTIARFPAELRETIHVLNKLNKKLKEVIKNGKE